MKILDRYIVRKFLVTFCFMLAVLAVLIVVIDFSEKLDDFLEKQIPMWETATVYYPNLVVFLVNMLCPLCVFLAVIIFTTKMAQDTEIVAILSSGIGFYRFLVPYLVASLAVGALSFGLNAYWAPEAVRKRMDFEYRYIKNKDEYGRRHIYVKIGKNDFVYMYSYNPYEYSGYQLALMRYEGSRLRLKINAQKAVWNPEKKS
ncbi:MAG: LptF/LptG family permease, partial [Bacteroidia bacterium]|nr:LptF/LptG family permease [Bacteroidia bacterium]